MKSGRWMIAVLSMAWGGSEALAGATLDAVRERGELRCGVNTSLAGFSQPSEQGWSGLDVDVCRAVAAAMFGDAAKVRFVPLSAQQRFTALQSGEVDMLSRNSTWSLSRDTSLGLDFGPTTFYDGQGFMVPRELGVTTATDLDGATVCLQPGTTTELNLADFFAANQMEYSTVVIEDFDEVNKAFFAGRCDAYTTDISGLAVVRNKLASNPDDWVILPEVISKEPLAPAVRHGDNEWGDIVKWSVFALLEAEELGISSENVDDVDRSSPVVQRFLGDLPGLGKQLGVDDRWAYEIVRQVGNYDEIYRRNIEPLGIERGLNRLWTEGGLMYAPPFR